MTYLYIEYISGHSFLHHTVVDVVETALDKMDIELVEYLLSSGEVYNPVLKLIVEIRPCRQLRLRRERKARKHG